MLLTSSTQNPLSLQPDDAVYGKAGGSAIKPEQSWPRPVGAEKSRHFKQGWFLLRGCRDGRRAVSVGQKFPDSRHQAVRRIFQDVVTGVFDVIDVGVWKDLAPFLQHLVV